MRLHSTSCELAPPLMTPMHRILLHRILQVREMLLAAGGTPAADDEGDAGSEATRVATAELRSRHLQRVVGWIAERPGRHGQPPSPSLCFMMCRVGTPSDCRWTLWQRSLGVHAMPPISRQAAQVRSDQIRTARVAHPSDGVGRYHAEANPPFSRPFPTLDPIRSLLVRPDPLAAGDRATGAGRSRGRCTRRSAERSRRPHRRSARRRRRAPHS